MTTHCILNLDSYSSHAFADAIAKCNMTHSTSKKSIVRLMHQQNDCFEVLKPNGCQNLAMIIVIKQKQIWQVISLAITVKSDLTALITP